MILDFICHKETRLDLFLRECIPLELKRADVSNSKIRRLIVSGSVFVNGKNVIRPAYELFCGAKIKVDFDEAKFFYEKPVSDVKFELSEKSVLYEDDYLIFIDKPAFFPVEKTFSGSNVRDNLHDEVVKYLWNKNPGLRNPPYVGIMHRLDTTTSGVILFTKCREVNAKIHEIFEKRECKKIYKALCTKSIFKNEQSACKNKIQKSGAIEKSFFVEKYIARVSLKSQAAKWGSVPKEKGGLYSKTKFVVLDEFMCKNKKYFLIQAELYTGRTHQIRVHLSESNFPIVGDELYGGIKAERIMLHSESLEFIHPITNKNIKVVSEIAFKKF